MRITKTQIDTWDFAGYYQFKIFQVVDAAHQVWYIGEPIGHGATKVADTLDDLKVLLEAEVPILNSFLAKVDKGWSK